MHTRKDGEATREKILHAACDVFGEKGFYKATHVEICQRAGVNTALINFHFGSKDGLYRAVWEYVADEMEQRYPITGGIPAQAPIEERLRGHIRAQLNRALDPKSEGLHCIRAMEMIKPTGILDDAFTKRIRGHRAYTISLLRELLGPTADQRTVELCEMSLISQCHMIIPPFPGMRKKHHRFVHADVDELAEHITQFTLAGIQAIRQQGVKEGATR